MHIKKLICAFIITSLLSISCAGQNFTYHPFPQHKLAPSMQNTAATDDPEVDKEFQIKDFGEPNIEKKISFVLLGLLAAGVTAASIAAPILLLKK